MLEVIGEIWAHIVVAVIVFLFTIAFTKRKMAFRKLLMLYYYKRECRISFGCLLVIKKEDKYLLIRNKNRPESFGPIGGVYKYYSSAVPYLETLSFRAHQTGDYRVNHDLRGFIPIENLNKIVQWYDAADDREWDGISREFKEEFTEDLHLNTPIITAEVPKCRRIRKVEEGPFLIKTRGYVQYRRLDIFELVPNDADGVKVRDYLFEKALHHSDMALVTVDEMKARRTKKKDVIGSYCGYLFSSQRIDGEDIHY